MKSNDVFLIDMDGIVANLHRKVAKALAFMQRGEPISTMPVDAPIFREEDFTNNSPSKGVPAWAAAYVKKLLAVPGFYADLEPMPDAVEGVERIVQMGLRPVILSSLGEVPGCAVDKTAWLQKWFAGLIHPRDYVFTSCKPLVRGAFYIDDGAEYLREWKRENPQGITITLARPYTALGDADCFAASWLSLVEFLRRYELPRQGRVVG